jgi:hypothetical protein
MAKCANLKSRNQQCKKALGKVRVQISNTLKFWVDVACEQRKTRTPSKSKHALIAQVLLEFEEAGDAMRYLDRKGRIYWKATESMASRLADAERDAKDELDQWP